MTTSRNTRRVQLGLLVLLVICFAQVGWWMLDQWMYMRSLSEAAAGAPELQARIDQARRMNRYLWEGGFFLLVLLAGMSVLARAVWQESQLRYRQQAFLAAVSHELRSPLASSRVAAETLLLREPPEADRERLLQRLLRNLRRLEDMVANLIDTARIEEGQIVLHPEPVQLLGALEPLLAGFRERAADTGLEFRIDLDPTSELYGDPEALRTVVRNLLDNAFKSVEAAPGGRVELVAERNDGRAIVSVVDSGVGFEARDRERMFERFWRPGDEMRRGGTGAGLGLYIARALATRSGGTLTAFSEGPGTGARFELVWPAADR